MRLTIEGILLLVALFCVIVLVGLGYSAYKEEKQWETFKVEHNCKEVAYMKGSTRVGIGPSFSGGQGGVTTIIMNDPDRVAWECDDGKTYWR